MECIHNNDRVTVSLDTSDDATCTENTVECPESATIYWEGEVSEQMCHYNGAVVNNADCEICYNGVVKRSFSSCDTVNGKVFLYNYNLDAAADCSAYSYASVDILHQQQDFMDDYLAFASVFSVLMGVILGCVCCVCMWQVYIIYQLHRNPRRDGRTGLNNFKAAPSKTCEHSALPSQSLNL